MDDIRKYLRPEVVTRIARLDLRARLIVEGFIAGLHRSPYHGFSVEFAQHREYVPGDDTRHIDWRVFARADRYYIKQYEEETNLRTHLLLDCSRSMAYPEQPADDRMTKWEYASCVAASLAYLLMHQQDAAGLLMFDHAVRHQMPPTSNRAQLRTMVELIDRAEPDRTSDMKMFAALGERITKRGLVVIVSDLLASAEDIIAGLQRLRYARHDVIVLHVLDYDEIEFPFMDNTLFEGMEDPDIRLLTDPQALRRSYLAAVDRFVRRVRGACANQRIDYVLMNTRSPLDVALSGYLAARAHALKAS